MSAIANVEQAHHWNSTEAEHWVVEQPRYDRMLAPFTDRLIAAAAIAPTDRVLDVGCGCGASTRAAARRARRSTAVGVDLSAPMLERAGDLAVLDGVRNVRFEVGDAQVHPFPDGWFDVAISRFGVMFFADPVAAFTNVATAVRPGGRLAFLCWQSLFDNEWITVPATAALCHVPMPDLGGSDAPGPFALADPQRVRAVLAAAGWVDVAIHPVRARQRFGDGVADVLEFIAGSPLARALLAGAAPEVRARALGAVADALVPFASGGGVHLEGAAWLVTARRGGLGMVA